MPRTENKLSQSFADVQEYVYTEKATVAEANAHLTLDAAAVKTEY